MNNQKYWHDGPLVTTQLHSHLVEARGYTTMVSNSVWPTDLSDPFDMTDMDTAVAAIWDAVVAGKKIGIIGDYDMDGTPAAVLLAQFFARIGHPYEVILPTRQEGYGFSKHYVDRLLKLGVGLIITVDCGITSVEEVEYAKSQKIGVVVTDHHQLPAKLPSAIAVVNPCRDPSTRPTSALCGTGVVFKLLQGLAQVAPTRFADLITLHWLAWQLDLVALATLSDMVPLRDENMHLVRLGLKILRTGRREGLQRFMTSIDLDSTKISYRDCTYKIIPRFNAAGRLDSMDPVFRILFERDVVLLDTMINSIRDKHVQSRILADTIFAQALIQNQNSSQLSPILLVSDPSWHPGVTGLVAGRLAKEFHKPSLVLANGGEGILRGSGRSYGDFNLFEALKPLSEYFMAFGGHAQAVGLSLSLTQLPLFTRSLGLVDVSSTNKQVIKSDGILYPKSVTIEGIDKLETLSPWGIGNPEPVWSLVGSGVHSCRWLGENKHLKLALQDFPDVDVMLFDAKKYFSPKIGMKLDLLGTLGINEFNGRRTAQMIVQGIVAHSSGRD